MVLQIELAGLTFAWCSAPHLAPRTTTVVVVRAYETSTLYRDLKLRGSIMKDRQLVTLPREQIYRKARYQTDGNI